MTDQPIAYTADGRPLYDNTPTVVGLIVENKEGKVLAVRRANDPGKGLLGLPAGYHMRGESWQVAGAREVEEETGVKVNFTGDIWLMQMETDEYGNNVAIGCYPWWVHDKTVPQEGEVLECVWVDHRSPAEDWAFPMHYSALSFYLAHHKLV